MRILLSDADGTLFPSEEPAFVASTAVTNAALAALGATGRHVEHDAEALRLATTGKNFRSTLRALAADAGVEGELTPDVLGRWVTEERLAVTAHLGAVLTPDDGVSGPLERLASRFELAAVSSSALGRLDACFTATALASLFPPARRYSAEDSLPEPRSKPDPAVYRLALEELEVAAGDAVAVEDAVPGAESAVAAGIPCIGILCFVPPAERAGRAAELRAAGVEAVAADWAEVEALIAARAGTVAAA
jgi:beta-phosphoglucomutase-like phosphatase (HAD superfamily)